MGKSERRHIPLFDLQLARSAVREVGDCLDSGWLTSGPKVLQFESEVGEYLKMEHTAAVSSATAGLQIVLSALGAGDGKRVITSPFTFAATIGAILHAGATPVLADIDPHTFNIDPDEVERKITDKTAAVVPVDIAGCPCDYKRLSAICEKAGIPLISDSAHAIGTKYRRKAVPHHTDASIFSFYSTKNLTCGEGGMVVSKHEALIDVVKVLRQHGLTKSTAERQSEQLWQYDVQHLGFKANLSDLHAAVGLGQLRSLKRDQTARRKIAARYIEGLGDLGDLVRPPSESDGTTHGWHLFILLLHLSKLNISRDRFIEQMAQAGIECGVHYQPIFNLSFFREALSLSEQYFPNAAYAGRRVVSLPFYPGLSGGDQEFVIKTARRLLKKASK